MTTPTPPLSFEPSRWRFIVEDRYGNIIANDLDVAQAKVTRRLSGPSEIEFQLDPRNPQIAGGTGVAMRLKPWGHWIHAVAPTSGTPNTDGTVPIAASCLVQPSDIDPGSGIMSVRAQGFSGYPKGMPWLQDWNPLVVNPFDVVARIWAHLQSYENGDLGVTIHDVHADDDPPNPAYQPPMKLPGFTFKDEKYVGNFFAIFIDAADKNDCGDYIDALARDTPFDYRERSYQTISTGAVTKVVDLAYPFIGVDQDAIVFRVGENVMAAKPATEMQMQWVSDIIMDGFWPGGVYSSQFTNADPDRYRRVVSETDVNIDSNERAAVWAKRQLTLRQRPPSYDQVVIDPSHPNAPWSSFDVGDLVKVQGIDPWMGRVNLKHKVMAVMHDVDANTTTVQLLPAEPNGGAFNYDPIQYVDYAMPPPPPDTTNIDDPADHPVQPPHPVEPIPLVEPGLIGTPGILFPDIGGGG